MPPHLTRIATGPSRVVTQATVATPHSRRSRARTWAASRRRGCTTRERARVGQALAHRCRPRRSWCMECCSARPPRARRLPCARTTAPSCGGSTLRRSSCGEQRQSRGGVLGARYRTAHLLFRGIAALCTGRDNRRAHSGLRHERVDRPGQGIGERRRGAIGRRHQPGRDLSGPAHPGLTRRRGGRVGARIRTGVRCANGRGPLPGTPRRAPTCSVVGSMWCSLPVAASWAPNPATATSRSLCRADSGWAPACFSRAEPTLHQASGSSARATVVACPRVVPRP
jgi:hypothetical protein